MTEVRSLPMTAGALLVDGTVRTHTSTRGDLPPRLHPVIRAFLDELPIERRERFADRCAEVVLLSDRLSAAEAIDPAGARAALRDARIRVTRVRELGDPSHGTAQPPCRSCAALLEWLGVEVVA